ncbi:c-type cytochrome [Luteimonas sp. RIT-PG2_3]
MSILSVSKTAGLALPLLAALALSACGGSAPAEDEGHGAASAEHATASSSAGLPTGHIDAGEQMANTKGKATGQSCIDCHGADGNVPLDETYPRLGGQYRDYLAHALQQYRSGEREHALMSQQATELSDQQIADLASYFASRPRQLQDLHGAY